VIQIGQKIQQHVYESEGDFKFGEKFKDFLEKEIERQNIDFKTSNNA